MQRPFPVSRHARFPVVLATALLLAAVLPGGCRVVGASRKKDPFPPMESPFHEFVRDGRARADIVVLDSARGGKAAGNLGGYIEKISGATLETAASLADSQHENHLILGTPGDMEKAGFELRLPELGDDGFCIRSERGRVLLVGETALSQCYAAYTFLEKYLGVRYFYPGEAGEYVPAMRTIRIGRINDVEMPDFEFRAPFGLTQTAQGPEWGIKIKLNVGVGLDGQVIAHRNLGHSWSSVLLPAEKYFDEHPEYYALFGGERRRPETKSQNRTQICTSNPEVVREVAKNICAILDANPGMRLIGCAPEDGEKFCQCDACVALDEQGAARENRYSRRVIMFVNAVADIVKETHPEAVLTTFVYWQYVAPPFDRRFTPRDNVIAQFCHSYCHAHPLEDPRCADNRDQFTRYIRGWQGLVNLGVFEYYWKAVWMGLYWPIVHSIREDIPFYKRMGCRLFRTQWAPDNATGGLNYYVAYKLLWDADLDVDALLADFHEKAYAEAQRPMKAYHELLEQAMLDAKVHVASKGRPFDSYLRIFTPEVMRDLDAHLTEAEGLVKDATATLRVRQHRLACGYTKAVVLDYLAPVRGVLAPKRPLWYGMVDEMEGEIAKIADAQLPKIYEAMNAGRRADALPHYTNYFRQVLASPVSVRNGVGRYFAGLDRVGANTVPVLDKGKWLKGQERRGITRERPRTVSLWIYGNDFDSSDEASEHTLALARRDAERDLFEVAPRGKSADSRNWCCVWSGLNLEDYPERKLSLTIANPSGRWTLSRFFALYVMPGSIALDPAAATRKIETDLEWIREQSIGFLEFPYDGYESHEGLKTSFEIPLDYRARRR